MTLEKKTSEDIFKFFDNFDVYKKWVDTIDGNSALSKVYIYCHNLNVEDTITKIQFPDKICEKFNFLYSNLFQVGETQKEVSYNKNHCSFLNYWLNNELNGKDNNASICVKDFYNKMKETDSNYFVKDLCGKDIYNLERYDIKNMNVLYNLYSIKKRISILEDTELSIEGSCSQHVNECYNTYKKGIINCEENCFAFCNALQMFKRIYDAEFGLLSRRLGPCKGEEIVVLPECKEVLEEYQTERNKQIKNTTLTILIPTFGFILTSIFFKFTPFGQFLGEKIRKKNILNTGYENENVLLSHLSDVENINSDDVEYNVGYYSSSNS
ncbi:PIR Superfamily Protein [Plasmodium ovale wallikeri]|uniref:PIR Superfamily Protein n=1 Tax=Plasmodium ovale wallikeri TaxID=864142 RepID=A0A1A9AMR2_PLAOA|nr:PIR Superfamily Protein [Plasmodium ovale wallikeri]SBT58109.1 PIR Superfamily Protein [Plasmodium ovale wallikeri]